jgi:hypothetical protein
VFFTPTNKGFLLKEVGDFELKTFVLANNIQFLEAGIFVFIQVKLPTIICNLLIMLSN